MKLAGMHYLHVTLKPTIEEVRCPWLLCHGDRDFYERQSYSATHRDLILLALTEDILYIFHNSFCFQMDVWL